MSRMDPRAKFNLKNANILLVGKDAAGMSILVQILVGFGAKIFVKCNTMAEAQSHAMKAEFDLMIVDTILGEAGDGFELVRWVRREAPERNQYAPLIMISAHTPVSKVSKARDCGAHFIITKPLTPHVLLQRILWVVREERQFVNAPNYAGPDRRFKFDGPPPNTAGRRADDLSEQLGAAKEPNMSQDQIDALMQPRKISL